MLFFTPHFFGLPFCFVWRSCNTLEVFVMLRVCLSQRETGCRLSVFLVCYLLLVWRKNRLPDRSTRSLWTAVALTQSRPLRPARFINDGLVWYLRVGWSPEKKKQKGSSWCRLEVQSRSHEPIDLFSKRLPNCSERTRRYYELTFFGEKQNVFFRLIYSSCGLDWIPHSSFSSTKCRNYIGSALHFISKSKKWKLDISFVSCLPLSGKRTKAQ